MSSGPAVAITTILFTALALISVFMRLLARLVFLKNGGRDEITIVISALSSVGLLVATLYQVKHGLGQHFDTLSINDFQEILKGLWISIIFYNFSLCLTKVSIVLQYMRVFPGPRVRLACWIILSIVAAYFIQVIITAIWLCDPIDGFWIVGKTARCIDKKFIWFFNASFNIFTDILIITLPVPVLSKLKLPCRQKIGLIIIFTLGGFVCLVSILRLHSLYVVSISMDITRDNADAALWSNIEVNVGIICASLQTIKPLVSGLFPRLLSSSSSNAYHKPQNRASIYQRRSRTQRETIFKDLEMDEIGVGKTITKVEAGEYVGRGEARLGTMGEKNSKDILVMISTRQDVERKISDSESWLELGIGKGSDGEKDWNARYR